MRHVTVQFDRTCETYELHEVRDWNAVAERVCELIQPGAVVALSGPLGAGKTTFTQTLAAQLGIRETPQSPTFSLLRSYRLPKKINGVSRMIHVDAYRIENEADLLPLDLDAELEDGATFLMLEWPENIAGWVKKRPHVISLSILM